MRWIGIPVLAVSLALAGCSDIEDTSSATAVSPTVRDGESGSTVTGEAPRSRTFRLDYRVVLKDLPRGAAVKVWFPVPRTTESQEVSELEREVPVEPQVADEPKYGNRIMHFDTTAGGGEMSFEVSWKVTRQEVHGLVGSAARASLGDKEHRLFLEANTRVPIDGKPLELIAGSNLSARDSLHLGRLLYDRVDDHLCYDKSKPGFGHGDVLWACDSRSGNCTDFHSLFISLSRSQGLPAKFEIGFPLPDQRGAGEIAGYHCWALYHVDGHGWIPTDISEADRHPELKEYYFGNLTENRVQFTVGRDLVLVPKQAGEPLNYFIYPHIEVNDEAWPDEKAERRFAFEDL